MKTPAFRKPLNKEIIDTEPEEYEFIVNEKAKKMRAELEQIITERTADSASVREMIFALAAQNYLCIQRKEDVL